MKDKILYLILGILIGAVITAGCFLVFSKNTQPDMRGGNRPDMSNMSEEELEKFKNERPEGGKGFPEGNMVEPPATENVVSE